jgi:hypothetical protein
MPITGTTISVTGTLTKVKRGFNRTITFEIELDNIAYLNRQSGASTGSSNRTFNQKIKIPSNFHFKFEGVTSSTTPSRHGNRFNYDSTTLLSAVSKPGPSSISLGKRKETDDNVSEHDEKRSHTASDQNE